MSADKNARPVFKQDILLDGICRMLNRGIQLRNKRTKELFTIIDMRVESVTRRDLPIVTYILRSSIGEVVEISSRKELAFRFESPETYCDPLLWLGDGI